MKKILKILTSKMFIFFALILVQVIFFVILLTFLESVSAIVQIILSITGLLLVLYISNKNQNPAYKIAWLILIMALPVFGMTMYFFFSQRRLGKKGRAKTAEILGQTRAHLHDGGATQLLHSEGGSAERQSAYIANTSSYPPYRNTQAKYYATGETFFEDLLTELEKAEQYIYMEYFILQEGKMWGSIREILEKKAMQGLDVRLMYDDIGCIGKLPGGYWKQMEQKGIKCVVFNPLRPVLNSLFNNRDHRKITVIDGITGFCGGANLADEYINAEQRFGNWKDASIRLTGEGVWSLLMMFAHLWSFTTDENIDDFLPEKPDYTATESEAGIVQPFADMPFDEHYVGEGVFLNMIAHAKKYLYINTPYLIPGNEVMSALTVAAQSGVDVRITVPGIPDKKTVYMVTQANCAQLVQAGVKVYEYSPGFIHSKTFVCDDQFGFVGTINVDFRSLYLNFECGVWLYQTPCIQDMKQDFLETASLCRTVDRAQIANTPWHQKFLRAVMRIFGPLM